MTQSAYIATAILSTRTRLKQAASGEVAANKPTLRPTKGDAINRRFVHRVLVSDMSVNTTVAVNVDGHEDSRSTRSNHKKRATAKASGTDIHHKYGAANSPANNT